MAGGGTLGRIGMPGLGDPDTGISRTIGVHIGRLRVKLSMSGPTAPQIISVRSFGHKIVDSPPGMSSGGPPPDLVRAHAPRRRGPAVQNRNTNPRLVHLNDGALRPDLGSQKALHGDSR